MARTLGVGRGIAIGTLALGVAWLMVAAPLAGAVTSVTYSSPFSHLSRYTFTTVSASGCHAYGSIPVPTTENLTSGTFSTWARGVTGNCGSGVDNVFAQTEAGFTGFQFTASTSKVTVAANWLLDWNARLTASGANGSYYNGSAAADVIVGEVLIDSSGNYDFTYTGTANLGLFDSGISTGTSAAHGHGITYVTNATFSVVPGTTYDILLTADASALVSSNMPGVLTYAQAYLAGQLLSVTVS